MARKINKLTSNQAQRILTQSAVMVLLWAGVGFGQVQRLQQNNPLDANPMVGGGGSNQPVSGYVPVNGNDVMTGNVTGLGYFHGSVPYSSTLQFGGSFKNNSINSFMARSTGGYNPTPNTGQMKTFYVPSQMVSTNSGQIAPGLVSPSTLSGFGLTLTGGNSANPASGLTMGGSKARAVQIDQQPATFTDYTKLSAPGVDDQQTDALFGLKRSLEVTPILETNTQNQNEIKDLKNGGTPGVKTDPDDPNKQSPFTLGRVDRVNERVKGAPLDEQRPQPKVGQSLEATSPKPLDPTDFKVSDEYQAVLNNVRQNSLAITNSSEPGGVTRYGVIPDATRFSFDTKPQNTSTDTLNKQDVDLVTGLPKKKPGTEGIFKPETPVSPTIKPDKIKADKKNQAGDGEGENKVVARYPKSVSALMIQAEIELKDGRYLHAAEMYQSALRLDAGNQEALIGRATAEIAGGMYESAMFDLKYLYTAYPEQIKANHNLSKTITSKRLAYIRNDLVQLFDKKTPTPAAFLLSYLYYQTSDTEQLRITMANWAQRWPSDAWLKTLRSEWLENKGEEKSTSTQPK